MSRTAKRKRSAGDEKAIKKQKMGDRSATLLKHPTVSSDALSWKKVALPDRLGDAEGFYDLEEIEDVEVVRDGTSHIMFRPKGGQKLEKPEHGQVVEVEWSGFGDEADTTLQLPESLLPLKWSQHRPKSILKSPSAKSEPQAADEYEAASSFALLDGVVEPDGTETTEWRKLSLSPRMLFAISNLSFERPTAIQSSAIPPILHGQDVIGKAVTGSGKTLAFGIPILEKWLLDANSPNPVALILAPTRELAHQLHDHLTHLAGGLDDQPRIVKVTGGLSILKQQRQLERADIIIATPGRLWEVINESHGLIDRLKGIKFLVVDEADRLLSEGHFKEVEDILETLDRETIEDDVTTSTKSSERQILVFSATFHQNLHQKLAGRLKPTSNLLSNQQSLAYLLQKLPFRSKPAFIDSNPVSQMSSQISESIVECAGMERDLYLYGLLLQHPSLKILVFTNSISSVKRLTPLLQNLSQSALALHSSMPQKARLRSMERFTASAGSHNNILVATDVAARGLDIKAIDLIIHYHVPRTADMYVHRSGRTARAEATGRSILLCSPDEVISVTRLISKVHGGDSKTPATIQLEREVIKRIRPRVELAQKIVEVEQAREKTQSKDQWLRNAAEELGVEYESDEFEDEGRRNRRGRGGGKEQKKRQKAQTDKDKVRAWKAELRAMLEKKVNLGVSERYLAGGKVDVEALLCGKSNGTFLEGR